MKKTSVVNLTIIIGLLVLCVMTLLAVYATGSHSSTILLLEENFNVLDESKWEHQTADCEEEGGQFHYYKTNGGLGYTEDGILYINLTNEQHRNKREEPPKCYSCISSQDSDMNCVSSLYSTKLQTRNQFEADQGRIEVRAKLPGGDWIKSFIGITRAQNETEPEDNSEGLITILNTPETSGRNGSAQLMIYLGSTKNQTIVKSAITSDEFHVYEIEWNNDKISFKIDQQHVGEEGLESGAAAEGNNSTESGGFRRRRTINQPFYLTIGVDILGKPSENQIMNLEEKRSLVRSNDMEDEPSEGTGGLQVDYIRLFKISLE